MKSFRDSVSIITGGSRGIGLALAKLLSRQGSRIIITSRDTNKLKQAASSLEATQADVMAIPCDISDAAQVEALFKTIEKRYSKIDILVNNAGTAHALLPADQVPVDIWRQQIDTNLTGMFLVTRSALPLMTSGGTIVNNLSVAADRSFPGMAAYNASKAGALGFTNVLREDLRKREIRVLALIAGPTDTEIWNLFWPQAPREKMISPETVAQAVIQAIALPVEASVEQIRIGPTSGALR